MPSRHFTSSFFIPPDGKGPFCYGSMKIDSTILMRKRDFNDLKPEVLQYGTDTPCSANFT
ncbi:hypothetical protein ARMGADRAFT_639116 [Armillaria gallica]|uniref:Uncharacterized protein n=1 Tax=Armillaria gallica TaxID=47427 RepID=A0A2H3DQC9_ARMGA|nr:hypothetical protein ARMGADRAFT_639116 [Armillaria gallica]